MNIFHDRFSTGQTVEATGVPNATLQSWLKRGLIVGGDNNPIEGGGSQGSHRRFSYHNVTAIAVASALIEAGMGSVPLAIEAGIDFAHVASKVGVEPDRKPGLPFDQRDTQGITMLAVAGTRRAVCLWQPGKDILASIRQRLGSPGGFVLLEIDPIFERVTNQLGYDHRMVLAAAYPGQSTAPVWDDAAIAKLVDKHDQ